MRLRSKTGNKAARDQMDPPECSWPSSRGTPRQSRTPCVGPVEHRKCEASKAVQTAGRRSRSCLQLVPNGHVAFQTLFEHPRQHWDLSIVVVVDLDDAFSLV